MGAATGGRQRASLRAGRLDAYGTTVFAEMSALAAAAGAINLGQGFPDESGPPEVLDAARAAIRDGENQYAPGRGVPLLLRAIAAHSHRYYGQELDPDRDILVTAGATEAIAATILALCRPGDEVVTFEPYYDSYAATIELAGAERRVVPLNPPGWGFDADDLRRAITTRTRAILLNTPHNPTGRVFGHEELELIAALCRQHDLIAVTDEVYEHLVFTGATHERLATFDGMADRTVTISSAGKTFSVTGWKIGWAIGNPRLIESVKAVKQFLTYTSGTPFQHAVAEGLRLPAERLGALSVTLQQRRDQLCDGLEALGWAVLRPQATYFATVDVGGDGWQFCRHLIEKVGVAAIPTVVFYDDDHKAAGRNLVRFAFCKREEVIAAALERLAMWPTN
jgi:N-succinyldiaminopimelate aminotransferase